MRRDFPVALAAPVMTAVLAADGTLSRTDGFVLMAVFAAWLIAVTVQARQERREADSTKTPPAWRPVIQGVAGLLILLLAGRLIVQGGTGIAEAFAISQFVMGATIVAVGTSIPELATAVIAKVRGHDDVSLGMMLGSNIFNSLWIVAVAAAIFPIDLDWRQVGLALAAGVIVMIAAFPPRRGADCPVCGLRRGGACLVTCAAASVERRLPCSACILYPAPFLVPPSSLILHPSSFILHPSS